MLNRMHKNKQKITQAKPANLQHRAKVAEVIKKVVVNSAASKFPSVQFCSTNRYGGKVVIEAVLLADMLG